MMERKEEGTKERDRKAEIKKKEIIPGRRELKTQKKSRRISQNNSIFNFLQFANEGKIEIEKGN